VLKLYSPGSDTWAWQGDPGCIYSPACLNPPRLKAAAQHNLRNVALSHGARSPRICVAKSAPCRGGNGTSVFRCTVFVGKQASVFAYASELNKWFKEREESIRNDKEEDSGANIPPPPPEVKRDVPPADDVAARTLAPPAAPQSVLAIDGPGA
jgi:hypothetical protein